MKSLKKITLFAILAIAMTACETDYSHIHDSGIANGQHNCSMYEYMAQDSVTHRDSLGNYVMPLSNWGLTLQMINKAGLQKLFQGNDPTCPKMTFLGPTSYTVLRYLLDNASSNRQSTTGVNVSQIDSATCRKLILSFVIPGKYMREDIPLGNYSVNPMTGGKIYTALGGNKVWLSTYKGDAYVNGTIVTGAGSIEIHGVSMTVNPDGSLSRKSSFMVASSNIEVLPQQNGGTTTYNGVVHSLPSSTNLGDM